MSKPILIFGSINMDLVARVPHLPKPGETLTGSSFSTVPGGKGANQAVAVAKLGGSSQMIGRVGNDSFGQDLLTSLNTAGVQTDRIILDRSTSSGVATIAVDRQGENHIIVIPGANGNVDESDLDRLPLTPDSILLLQLEIPLNIVQAAAKTAKAIGATVILDPAPAPATFPDELYRAIDILTPNTTETEQLVGFTIHSIADAERAAQILQQRGTQTVILKMGAQGAYCATKTEQFFTPAFPVNAIDTVAAGDAFNAGLAIAIAEGQSIQEALRWGSASGALSTTQSGAQSSLCDRVTLEEFLEKQNPELS